MSEIVFTDCAARMSRGVSVRTAGGFVVLKTGDIVYVHFFFRRRGDPWEMAEVNTDAGLRVWVPRDALAPPLSDEGTKE